MLHWTHCRAALGYPEGVAAAGQPRAGKEREAFALGQPHVQVFPLIPHSSPGGPRTPLRGSTQRGAAEQEPEAAPASPGELSRPRRKPAGLCPVPAAGRALRERPARPPAGPVPHTPRCWFLPSHSLDVPGAAGALDGFGSPALLPLGDVVLRGEPRPSARPRTGLGAAPSDRAQPRNPGTPSPPPADALEDRAGQGRGLRPTPQSRDDIRNLRNSLFGKILEKPQ